METRKIIVNSNCYHGYSLKEAAEGIAQAGFHHIELTATKGWTEHVFPTMSFQDLLEKRELLRDYGLAVPAMSGHCNLMDPERIPDFVRNIHLARFFGADTIVSSVGEAHLKDLQEGGTDEVVKHIRSFLPILEDYGMTLVLETHGAHGTAARLAPIVDGVASSHLAICYDTGNVIFYGDVKDTSDLESQIDHVRYFHLKDKAGKRREWNFPALGEGYVDFPAIFSLLEKYHNTSSFSIEIEFTQNGPRSLGAVDNAVALSGRYLTSHGFTL